MKKTVYLTFLLLTMFFFRGSFLYAQKISFKTIKFKHIQLPLKPLGKNIKTYHSEVSISLPGDLSDDASLKNLRLDLAGFQSINTDDPADIRINLNFDAFALISRKRVKDDVYHINTGSNETGYYDILTFDYPADLIVSTWDYKVLLHRKIHPDSSVRIEDFGKWTFSEEELSNKFDSEISKLQTETQKKCVHSVMNKARDLVNGYYGYPVVTERLKIATVKSKKGPFYSELQQAADFMEEGLTMSKKYESNPESERLIGKSIDIWKNILAGTPGSKSKVNHDLKLLLLYNSAQGNLWINRFAEARSQVGQALKMLDKNTPKKQRNMIRELRDMISNGEQRYDANQ